MLTFEERNKVRVKKNQFEREAADLAAQVDRALSNLGPYLRPI